MLAPITVSSCLDQATRALQQSQMTGSPRLDSELLLGHVLEMDRTQLYCRSFDKVATLELNRFQELVDLRALGTPIAYLLGKRDFFSRTFVVNSAVLIPRPETEVLVEESLKILDRSGLTRPRVLDIGTGSGCIAVTLALELEGALVRASDVSSDALQVAQENAQRLGAERLIKFFQSDLFDQFEELGVRRGFDLIVSNPPYVATDCGPRPEANVVRYEPATALWSGRDGLDHIRRLVNQAPDWLNPGASLVLEMASFQVEGVEALMQQRGFEATSIIPDLSGLPRVVVGRWES